MTAHVALEADDFARHKSCQTWDSCFQTLKQVFLWRPLFGYAVGQ